MAKLLYIDTETTGVSVDKGDHLIQVAWILEENGRIVDTFEGKCRPKDDAAISVEALSKQRRTLEQITAWPERSVLLDAVISRLNEYVKDGSRLVLVGHNVMAFDSKMMREFLSSRKVFFGKYFMNEMVDTLHLTMLFRLSGLLLNSPDMKLPSLAKTIGFPIGESAHDALVDVRATREVFLWMNERLNIVDKR